MAPTIYVVYYSMYGHIYKLAKEVVAGLEAEGVTVKLFQVPETLPEEVLGKMHAPPKQDVPLISANDLTDADGFVFGYPTRFGNMAGQFKQFWDSTGGLWMKGALAGKPFSIFTSTASQGGGQENTIASSLSNFVHHGMVFVPPGYTMGAELYDLTTPRGGSAWGAGTFTSSDGSRQPSEVELKFAKHQGKIFGQFVNRLK
ncbi:hypothetical protein WJX73_001933 [Symbiochloris irregularis]|uniref:NAD(P)H dehydrogenase (quinone) n=1 Tax=Symbiochloris irregularis TaxID=706552 RepID=A0AAW1PMA6_9CHLO